MFLESIVSAVPPHRFTQPECLVALASTPAFAALKPRSRGMMEKILGNGASGIVTRSFCLPEIAPVVGRDAQQLNETFEREAPRLAAAALVPALEKAGIVAADLDALFICTCTGYLCPGVTSHVAELLGLRNTAYLQDLVAARRSRCCGRPPDSSRCIPGRRLRRWRSRSALRRSLPTMIRAC